MTGARRRFVSAVPVVIDEASESSQTKIFPVTYQDDPTVSVIVPLFCPSSRIPATRISKVCSAPLHSNGNQGVISISCSLRSKASNPTIGRQSPGTTPPVKITGKGH